MLPSPGSTVLTAIIDCGQPRRGGNVVNINAISRGMSRGFQSRVQSFSDTRSCPDGRRASAANSFLFAVHGIPVSYTHLDVYKRQLQNNDAFAGIITHSRKMRALFQYLEAVAVSAEPVLIGGETGAGKEMFAHALHKLSGLTGQFVQVNVSGLDDTLFSDTLFGHK